MKRRKIIAIAIAVALQPWYTPAFASENNDDNEDCPKNISLLSKEERKKLSAACLAALPENDNHWGWVTGGVAALVAGVAIGIDNNGGGHVRHQDTSPLPPDDNVTPIPPDDGGDDVTPPDDGGDVTPPDDGGDVTPPDDGGDVTPPDDGGDVTPPDDGGDVTPPDTRVNIYNNGVTSDHGAATVTLDELNINTAATSATNVVLSWQKSADGNSYILTAADGTQLVANKWHITDDNNAVFSGTTSDGRFWKYDSRGNLIVASKGALISDVDGATHTSERGLAISGENETGVIISGDGTQNTLNGDSTVSDGAIGIIVTGDNTINTISGQSTTDGATGAFISGNGTTTNISGGIDVTDGGTGLVIDGNDITIDNTGISDISGEGSTGSIINGNNARVVNEGEMTITDGGTGGKITGDNANVDNKGDSSVSGEGSTALIIDGDGTTLTTEGTQEISDGATGVNINGDDTTASVTGDITVNSGGTAMIIDGDNSSVNITGASDISGQGSIGTIINGDKARITNDGELNVADGGTGAKITGNGAVVDNTGDVTASGTGSTALYIDGDDALIISQGQQTITDGAIGTRINGDNTRIANTGNITTDGAGSIAAVIDGNDSSLIQTGDLLVTNGATGIVTYGENNTLTNTGNATVYDDGSVGFWVAGTGNTFSNKGNISVSESGTGAKISGDNATVSLGGDINVGISSIGVDIQGKNENITIDGDINVIALSEEGVNDKNGLRFTNDEGYIGFQVSSNNQEDQHTTLTIEGNVNVTSERDNPTSWTTDTNTPPAYGRDLAGGIIDGTWNDININGGINVSATPYHVDLASGISSVGNAYRDSVTGLIIHGENNHINVAGGINVSSEQPTHDWTAVPDVTGIEISGKGNVITVDGASSVTANSGINNNIQFATISNNSSMVMNETSTLDINLALSANALPFIDGGIIALDGNSALTNKGTITGDITSVNENAVIRASNSTFLNDTTGSISLNLHKSPYSYVSYISAVVAVNSSVVNKGSIDLTSDTGALMNGSGVTVYGNIVEANSPMQFTAIRLNGNSTGLNEGSISTTGGNTWGLVTTDSATAHNTGVINHQGAWQDGSGNNINCQSNISFCFVAEGGGVAATDSSTIINDSQGVINVVNAGIGMWANGGNSTVINQGTINLTRDDSVGTDTPMLIGMAATAGGMAINDATGVINIDASYGQAFYADKGSYIINNGQINLNGSPMDDADTHMGTTPGDQLWLQTLTGSGDSDIQTSTSGFFSNKALANYGNETLNGNVDVNNWLYNEANAALTVNDILNINAGGLENKGTLDADKINANVTLYNRAGGSITTDLLTLGGDTTFFNDGDFTGSISGSSYKQEIVNTGNMTVAEDGSALISGSFAFYNQQGATLTNTGNTVQGGANTIINMTRTSDSIAQVNSGTITATNGYSAITTANASNVPVWIWNTATGVINGVAPDAPLINLSRGYNFGNQGTINVQGDNAVAISGGHTSYEVNLVNDGIINVGTEQGKADRTNGTGLIGIKGNGSNTTINNTADGVINVYADNSYAFGGQTKTIINNGAINLLCDTGCAIYAPGTTGSHTDGAADIVIPAAGEAPSQGNIPTPPADPNAPQQLSNYIVGTNADGSSGTLKANNLVIGDNVKVGTGFTAGTADTTIVVDNAFTGSNIQGAENITSTSVVWNAQGSTDTDGNVDVTMTKNAYTDVATDSSVNSVAQALDAGYTNNELYNSLNVGTTAELNSALKQVSGSQANTVFREARVLSNRFNMLADAAPQVKEGLAFNVVAKGDPRAELGNDTQYDMLALRQSLDLTSSQNLTLEYGIARLDGDGSQNAGDNGLTGGYSQFFGLKHSMAFEDGLAWNNALRYDVHNLDSNRSVSYGDVSKVADSSTRQQYLEFRSEGAKTFTLDEGLSVTPYAGVKLRHTLEDGYKERSAGDFNLSMNSGSETAVDSIVGLKANYTGQNGWSANMTLEGGPNLSYSKNQRSASLQGAAGQQFSLDDVQKGGGMNGLATVGVKYSAKDASLNLDAYQWKEDGISDKGFMLNFKKTFR